MKKIFYLFLSVCMMLLSCACFPCVSVSAADTNLIKNGDFSRRMNDWHTWTSGDATFEYQSKGGVNDSGCMLITNKNPVAASVFQYVNLEKGKSYLLSMDVRYENVSMEGPGVTLGSTMYDAAGNNIGESVGASRYGSTSEWTTMTMIIKIDNENCAHVTAGPRLWFSTGKVWVDNISLRLMDMSDVKSQTFEMALSDTPNKFTTDALGVEWDPKLLLPCNIEKGVTEEDLNFMKERLDVLGVQAVRMMIMPEWFEPQNDNDDPLSFDANGFKLESNDIKTTLAYLKVCHELGITVTLTWWGAAAGSWLAFPNCNDWVSAPNNKDEIAENISWFIQYVKNELKYDCIYNVILMNEPSYAFHIEGGAVDFPYYVECYKAIRARLDADGLEDIRLVGSDDAQSSGWYMQSYDALKDVCDAFNSHTYQWVYDTPYLDTMVQEFVSTRTQYGQDKPFFLGEFGDGSSVGAYYAASVETYGRGLYVAAGAVNAFKAGASGLSYWGLHDVYYYINDQGGDNGGLMETGLIGYKTDGAWRFRPSYYAWGMMCNYIPFGSEIYNVTGDNGNIIDTVAVKTPEGKWSILAVNRSGVEQTVKISAAAIGVPMNEYLFSEATLPTDGSMIASSAVSVPADGVYTVTLPAWSFKVLSDIHEVPPVAPEDTETDSTPESSPADDPEVTEPISENDTADTSEPSVSSESDESVSQPQETVSGTDAVSADAEGGCASVVSGGLLVSGVAALLPIVLRRKKREA